MIDGSRRARIARGSGSQVSDVNGLVDRFFEARKMMTAMANGQGMPGLPGIPGMGKRGKARQVPKKGKAKRGSGNPAKRAAAEQAGVQRRAAAPGEVPSAFGGGGKAAELPEDFELPKEFRNLLPPTR
jgi:signal recognition particle subunit SRP54